MKKSLTIISILLFSVSCFAQIPNGGFESWNTMNGYNSPDGWDNSNSMGASMSVYTCSKGTPGHPGTAYLMLTSKNMSGTGVVPGVATAGMLDMTNMSAPVAMNGFAFTQRPASMGGIYEYMGYSGDVGFISALLTKWNSSSQKRDTIASLHTDLTGMVMSWGSFSYNFNYASMQFPDTAFIMLSASGATPAVNSYLYVDTLHFAGSVAGVSGINENTLTEESITVYPNPSADILNIGLTGVSATDLNLQLISAEGTLVQQIAAVHTSGKNQMQMNVSGIAKGIYLLKISSSDKLVTRRVVIIN